MKLSIITVCLNAANSIKGTLDSVRIQTFKDFEFIIIDGGSDQETLNLIESNSDIIDIFVSEPDNGLYHAMNKGIALSKGEWLIFMNADDSFYSANILSDIFSFDLSDFDLIIGDYNDGISYRKAISINKKSLSYGMPTTHQSMFFRKKNYLYNLEYKIASDYDFLWNYFNNSESKIFFINKIISKININGISRKNRIKNSYEFYKIANKHAPGFNNVLNLILRIFSNEIAINFPLLYEYLKKFTSRNREVN
jgi:glycosyltransferase involved in cell wall biosynthesis